MCIFDDIRMHRATLFGDSHGAQPQACEERLVTLHIRIAGGQQFFPIEDRVGAGGKAQCLQLVAHLLAARRQPDHRLRHQQARDRDGAHEFERIQRHRAMQRCARHLHQAVDRHRIRMRGQVGQRQQQAGALRTRFAHAHDAAAAGLHAGLAHVFQRIQAILVLAGMDDLAVEIRGGIQVVVVVVQPGRLQCIGLRATEHTQGGAGFQAQRFHLTDHRGDLGDVTVLG